MAPESPPSESTVRKDMDALLEMCLACKKWGDRISLIIFVLVTVSIVAIPYAFFHFGGESFWIDLLKSLGSLAGFCAFAFMMMGMSLTKMQEKGVEAFNKRFPEDDPERTLALEILQRKAAHNNDLQELYATLSGHMAKADDKPADEKLEDALAQLGPPPATPNPAPVSSPAALSNLDHIPLQPDEQKPAG